MSAPTNEKGGERPFGQPALVASPSSQQAVSTKGFDQAQGHTPGPWLRIDKADYAEIQAAFRPSSPAVALVAKAEDADLIAAAPDLLAACQAFIDRFDGCSRADTDYVANLMRTAITKARAGAPL